MKNIINESWGKLAYDEKNKTLVVFLHKTSKEQFNQLIDRTAQAVEEYGVKNCIVDLKDRTGGTEENVQYSAKVVEASMQKGLKRMAIIYSKDEKEKQLTRNFISKIGSDQVKGFTNSEEALSWLNSSAGGGKLAA